MKRNQLLYSLLIIIACGCHQNSSDKNSSDQKEKGAGSQDILSDFVMKYSGTVMQDYGEKAYSELVNLNYKFPSATHFEQVINDVYHIDIKKEKFDDIDLVDENGPIPIAIRQKNFIYMFDHVAEAGAIVDGKIALDMNNYLFYKDARARKSLLNSVYSHYLFDLVEKFGYTDDDFLVKYVLDKNYKNEDSVKELGSIIFTKNKNGGLEIRTGILKSIVNNTTQTDIILARNIQRYCIGLISNDIENSFSDAQKAKIIAFASNSIDPIYKKYHRIHNQYWGTGSILSYYINNAGDQAWSNAEKSYVKEKYYNLPHLSEMIDYAREFDSIGAPD